MKNRILSSLVLLLLASCTHYSHLAKFNTKDSTDGQTRLYNEKLNISTLNYGDVKFAFSDKEFKTLNPKSKPAFKHIIFYGQTHISPYYHYYLIEGSAAQKDSSKYLFFEYNFQDKNYVLALSNKTPKADLEFITSHISQYLK